MSETTNRRFAISTLSKTKIADAYNGELIGDKYTGEILFKTPDGDGISYMANARRAHNIDTLVSAMRGCGYDNIAIYEANSNISLPSIVSSGEALSVPFTDDIDNRFTAYSILIDIDCFEKNISGITHNILETALILDVTIYYDGDTSPVTKTISIPVAELKGMVFALDSEASGISVNAIVNAPMNFDETEVRMILHNIMIATNVISR